MEPRKRQPHLEDTIDSRSTQPLQPVGVRRTPPEPPKRKRGQASSPASIPVWAVGLMLLLAIGIAGGIAVLFVTLGGQTEPGGSPRIIIVTAPPLATNPPLPTSALAIGAATAAPALSGAVPQFALEGPTLPPIIFTPTPLSITVGSAVLVNIEGLNVRPEPSLNNVQRFNASLNSGFNVVDGPIQADGLTWWEIQDPADPSRRGWAAADYLDVFAP